jgi:hypothetical protein
MRQSSLNKDTNKSLAVSLSEPKARREVAKKAGLPSGALPVLAALVLAHNNRQATRPRTLYAAEIASERLVRAYISKLIGANLVSMQRLHGCRFLSPTLDGLALTSDYTRRIRAGTIAFSSR